MSDVLSVQHPPAVRVGGRRLSISVRPKPHAAPNAPSPTNAHPTENADYPRPAAQGEGEDTETHPPPHEEEAPKKEKKHGHGDRVHDQNRLKESAYGKLNATMPSKDHLASKHAVGGAGRIGQPMGKTLTI